MEHNHQVLDDLREPTRSLRHAIPETWTGFQSLHGAAMADGQVPASLKEGGRSRDLRGQALGTIG